MQIATVPDHSLEPLLAEHEAVIERGLKSFVEVGEALAAIRDQRLYRATHHTFDAYLAARWPELGGRNYAHKVIRAAKVAVELGTDVPSSAPSSEGQVRPLLRLEKADERRAAWQQAGELAQLAGRREPTARDVEAAVTALTRKPQPPPDRSPIVCRICGQSLDRAVYGDNPVHCEVHGGHSRTFSACAACRADASKTHPADLIRTELALLSQAAAFLAEIEEHLTALPVVELWDALGEVTTSEATDTLGILMVHAGAIEDLIIRAEQAGKGTTD